MAGVLFRHRNLQLQQHLGVGLTLRVEVKRADAPTIERLRQQEIDAMDARQGIGYDDAACRGST